MLKYRPHAQIDDLAINEATVHRASGAGPARWWVLWFVALRDTDGQPETFCVPINPEGPFVEQGPGGRTWSISCPAGTMQAKADGTHNWQISPSINVLDDLGAVAGTHLRPSIWHHTPEIVGVPDSESWAKGIAP